MTGSAAPPPDPIRVLFVCTHNSARSQIAEALLGKLGGPRFEAHSAGTEATRVNPYAQRVLAESGVDWSNARSKVITEFVGQHFDYVVTVCDRANATCPYFPGSTHRLHWSLDDPSAIQGSDADRLGAFRRTAREVEERLRPLIAQSLAVERDRLAGGRP